MRNQLLKFAAVLALAVSNNFLIAQCEDVAITVSSSDESFVQLYHAGFFLFGATENVGGFDNLCFWTVRTMDGTIIHEAETSGDWESQSFMMFEHEVSVEDSMVVELVLSSPLEENDCCISDTLVWVEEEIIQNVFISYWSFQEFNSGVNCDAATSITDIASVGTELIYPQPANDRFWIEGYSNAKRLMIYDLTGKIVSDFTVNASRQSFDISGLPHGLYVIHITDEQGRPMGVQRLVKEN